MLPAFDIETFASMSEQPPQVLVWQNSGLFRCSSNMSNLLLVRQSYVPETSTYYAFLAGYGMFWTYISAMPLTSRDQITLLYTILYKACRPNFQNPVQDWNPLMPRCIGRENLQQQNHWNIIQDWPYLASLSHGGATASLKCVLP